MNFIINILKKILPRRYYFLYLFSIELQANKGLQLLVDENYDVAFRETYSLATLMTK